MISQFCAIVVHGLAISTCSRRGASCASRASRVGDETPGKGEPKRRLSFDVGKETGRFCFMKTW